MSRKSLLIGSAAALVAAAVSGWQGARFNLGSIMGRFATREGNASSSGNGRKLHSTSIAQAKRNAIKAKNRHRNKLAHRG